MEILAKSYEENIIKHYEKVFNNQARTYIFDKGPFEKLPANFRVLEFPPIGKRAMWTYATCCMSQPQDLQKIELHLFSSVKDDSIIELLTALAYYHRTTDKIGLNHTVNLGRPWQNNSKCTYGLVSLPYLDGPDLEDFNTTSGLIKFFWLLPVTVNEVEYKTKYGIEALESKFDQPGFNYLDPDRASTITIIPSEKL